MSRNVYQQYPDVVAKPLAIEAGGTGQKTASTALNALGGLSSALISQANGAVPLDNNTKIPLQFLPTIDGSFESIYGPSRAFCGILTKYWISDFDFIDEYLVSCTDGTVTINGNEIHYTPPATPGNYGFTVNQKFFSVPVIASYIEKPIINAPVNNFISHLSTFPIDLSFIDYGIRPTSYVTLITTEMTTDPTFQTIDSEFQTVIHTGNSENISLDLFGLTRNTEYYVRLKVGFADTVDEVTVYYESIWSDTLHFSVSNFLDFFEYQTLISAEATANDLFGSSVALSADGTRAVVGVPGADLNGYDEAGAARVFIKIDNLWVLETVLKASDRATADNFGLSVTINEDGSYIVVGAPLSNAGGLDNSGAVYIYAHNGVNWVEEQKITHTGLQSYDLFGHSVAIDATGTRIAVGAPGRDQNLPMTGSIFVFTRNVNTWLQEVELSPIDLNNGDALGYFVAITKDGTKIAASQYNTKPGSVYVFSRTGTAWTLETKILDANTTEQTYFGYSLAFNGNGNRFIIGAPYANNKGAVYIYDFDGVNWNLYGEVPTANVDLSEGFGWSIAIDNTGNRIIVGIPSSNKIKFYTYENNIWTEQLLPPSTSFGVGAFGRSVSMSSLGDEVLIGAPTTVVYDANLAGKVFVFRSQ